MGALTVLDRPDDLKTGRRGSGFVGDKKSLQLESSELRLAKFVWFWSAEPRCLLAMGASVSWHDESEAQCCDTFATIHIV